MVRYPLEWNQILNRTKYNTFGWVRKHKDGTAKFHQGWDLVSPMGTPVYPVAAGEVVGVQYSDIGDYGKTINLRFEYQGKTFYAFYAHLFNVMVTKGFKVENTNLPIGSVGDTGNAKGIAANKVHLHFEFRDRALGGKGTSDRIDPVEFLGEPPYDGLFYIDDEQKLNEVCPLIRSTLSLTDLRENIVLLNVSLWVDNTELEFSVRPGQWGQRVEQSVLHHWGASGRKHLKMFQNFDFFRS